MNDADLGDNIGDESNVVDGKRAGIDNDRLLDPTRWWFASSAFPMMAGTLGPVASAFSICALVRPWRQYITPGDTVTEATFITDPIWLTVINAVQLAIAVVANVFLLLNMAKRVRFAIAQPVTITGWYISALTLVGLAATASGPLVKQPGIDYVWSPAYWYGIYAAVLYFIVASLMVITIWGARAGHYDNDFELSPSQRTLMLQTIMFLVYLLVGALVFTTVEGWNYLDAVYWADVTLFTVGYGDFSPQTRLGRGLLIPYALVGVISLGLVIGSIRSLVLDRGKRRLDARMMEKKRRAYVKALVRRGKEDLLKPIGHGLAAESPDATAARHARLAELQRRQKEFDLMRKIQDKASTRRRWTAMATSSAVWAVLWLVGAKIFQECEANYGHWTYFESFYFAFTGLTTIGYGDLTPVSPAGKAFFVFWSLLALPATTVLISNAGDTIVKVIRDGTIVLGNLSILPSEHGFNQEAKRLASKFAFFGAFNKDDQASRDEDKINELPPGFLGASQPRDEDEDEDEAEESFPSGDEADSERVSAGDYTSNNEDSTGQAEKPPAAKEAPRASREVPAQLPKTRSEYHLALIDEIVRVTEHLRQSPPRKYTFKEWAWYLRLTGEDESSAETHHKPNLHAHRGAPESAAGGTDARPKWSWVGHRSPLMDAREEAQWILDRLEQTLKKELQAVVRAQDGEGSLRQTQREERRNEYEPEGRDPGIMGGGD